MRRKMVERLRIMTIVIKHQKSAPMPTLRHKKRPIIRSWIASWKIKLPLTNHSTSVKSDKSLKTNSKRKSRRNTKKVCERTPMTGMICSMEGLAFAEIRKVWTLWGTRSTKWWKTQSPRPWSDTMWPMASASSKSHLATVSTSSSKVA